MIYVFLADGFEEIEALSTVDILRRANINVKTVGVGTKTPTGTHNITVEADILLEDATTCRLTGVVLPGGVPGTPNLKAAEKVEELTRYVYNKGGLVSAICAAPSVLGEWGLLEGKKAVCYPGYEDKLKGAVAVDDSVVIDGMTVTGKGAGVATDFALALVTLLKSEKESNKIKEAMQCSQ